MVRFGTEGWTVDGLGRWEENGGRVGCRTDTREKTKEAEDANSSTAGSSPLRNCSKTNGDHVSTKISWTATPVPGRTNGTADPREIA